MKPSGKRLWGALLAGPLWFLVMSVLVTVYLGARGIPTQQLPAEAEKYVPTVLLLSQLALLGTLHWVARKDSFDLRAAWNSRTPALDIAGGLLTGAVIAVLYFTLLSPLHVALQTHFGDYVPAGETMRALGGQLLPFFAANVLLAPYVEEQLYRNYALTRLSERYGQRWGLLLSAMTFGLLHWLGGAWYILLTAVVIGVPFALIRRWRGNMLWPYAAHLALNALEFWRVAAGGS